MPSWIGPWEIAIVVVIVVLIFGPRKLPELGSSLGKSIRGFRKGMKEGQDELDATIAEVKEAVAEPQVTTSKAASTAATAEASATVATAETVAAVVTAEASSAAGQSTGRAPAGEAPRPQCWGTWEEGNADCQRCAVGSQCADETAGTLQTE